MPRAQVRAEMARYGEAVTRAVRAVSAATGLPVTGDAANIDLYVVQDSGSPAPVSGSITEEGYGYYSVDLTAAENTCWTGRIIGESSTSNVVIIGVQWDNHSPVEDVADAVWDEDLGGHTVEDSAGQELDTIAADVDGLATSDEVTAQYTTLGNMITALSAKIGAFTGTGVNTILGFFRALMRSDATLPADVGGTFDPTTDALEALRNRGDSGAWSGAAGSGSNKVEVTASDGAGLLANGVKVTVEDADGNTVGILTTNSLGVVIFYLDDGTYTFVTATTSFWQGSSTEVEVSGDTAVALTLSGFTPPDPPTGDYCTVYGFAESVGGTIAAGTVRIRALHAPDVRGEDDEPVAVFFSDQDTATFDANGYWHLAVLRNAVVDIHFEYSNGDDQWARKLVIPDQPSGNWKTFEMA